MSFLVTYLDLVDCKKKFVKTAFTFVEMVLIGVWAVLLQCWLITSAAETGLVNEPKLVYVN